MFANSYYRVHLKSSFLKLKTVIVYEINILQVAPFYVPLTETVNYIHTLPPPLFNINKDVQYHPNTQNDNSIKKTDNRIDS